MVFGSLDECVAYIKTQMGVTSKMLSKESKEKATDIIRNELIGYDARPSAYAFPFQGSTGATENTPTIVGASPSGFTVELQDNGDWYSVITGEHFFSLEGLEHGTTWGREASNIMDTWEAWNASQMPNKFASKMRSLGVPIY